MMSPKGEDGFIAAFNIGDCSTVWSIAWGSQVTPEAFNDIVVTEEFMYVIFVSSLTFLVPLLGL